MAFTMLGALLIGRGVGFRSLLTVREELGSVDSPRNTLRLLGQIVGITFLVEALGATALAISFVHHGLGYGEGIFRAVFHAIMAFCNSGLPLYRTGI